MRWIPVNEKLPCARNRRMNVYRSEAVFVTVDDNGKRNTAVAYLDNIGIEGRALIWRDMNGFAIAYADVENKVIQEKRVVAWMKFFRPQPFRGGVHE